MMSARSAGCIFSSLLVRDAQLHASQRIRLDQVDEFPPNGALRKLFLHSPDHSRRGQPLQEAPRCAGQADVHVGDAQFDGTVGALLGEVQRR